MWLEEWEEVRGFLRIYFERDRELVERFELRIGTIWIMFLKVVVLRMDFRGVCEVIYFVYLKISYGLG